MTDETDPSAADWDGGREADERRQREAWLRTTPAQRLAWLADAIAFAHRVGALPRRDDAAAAREQSPDEREP